MHWTVVSAHNLFENQFLFHFAGCTKLYRYEGIVPNDPTYPPVVVKDPRSAMSKVLWSKLEPLDLPVPQFKVSLFP
jgi:hypothetical protein